MLKARTEEGPVRVIPTGLLVEFGVLLVDKLTMGRECGGEALKTFRLKPFMQIREEKGCWERVHEVRELGAGRELPEGRQQQRRGLGAGCFQGE